MGLPSSTYYYYVYFHLHDVIFYSFSQEFWRSVLMKPVLMKMKLPVLMKNRYVSLEYDDCKLLNATGISEGVLDLNLE